MNQNVRRIPENGMLVADVMIGLLANSVHGRAESVTLIAQFTSMELAREYEKQSKLPEPETVKGNHSTGGEGVWPLVSQDDYGFRLTYKEGSLLRWYNPIPEEPNGLYRVGMFTKLNWFNEDVPIDPSL